MLNIYHGYYLFGIPRSLIFSSFLHVYDFLFLVLLLIFCYCLVSPPFNFWQVIPHVNTAWSGVFLVACLFLIWST